MKVLYLECSMGAAGDMLMAALMDLIEDQAGFLREMNNLGIPGVHITCEKMQKCGIYGNHVHVFVHGEEEGCGHGHHHYEQQDEPGHYHHHKAHHHTHHHSALAEIYSLIDGLPVSKEVKNHAKAVYQLIAEAEGKVHGQTMDQIHFHEVGTLDAVADVVGVCLLMEKIGADKIVVSPVHVGSGTVKCAHGILPVPAPATALLLNGVPTYSQDVRGELCTPTGAALLKYFGDCFARMPLMTVERIGYGMGTKDFDERANCLRAMIGQTEDEQDEVIELAANIDDMTAEEMGFAMEQLFQAGALDVYAEHITMKKSRPAIKLVCMCRAKDEAEMTRLMFMHTTTIGIRIYTCRRAVLERRIEKRQTVFGQMEKKICAGYGVSKEKWEFEDLAQVAQKNGKSIMEVKKEIDEGNQ
ncbi:MAG: nickel pincer cofactor biosynthesis protein LarC [Emergencia sp.]